MKSDRRSKLAKLFLIFSFPFWFPRMVFWMFYEFFCFQIRDWLPPQKTKPDDLLAEGDDLSGQEPNRARFRVLPGNNRLAPWHKLRKYQSRPKLRVLFGGQPTEGNFSEKARAQK